MDFQPVIPLGGVAGWEFLTRTSGRQSESFANAADIKRETTYFKENIANITTAKELVADRQLLKVALGAFGLADDLNKQFFIRKVLEEGTDTPGAMANRLVDRRYAALTDAFDFASPFGPRTGNSGFAAEITSAYETRSFEVAVGQQNEPFRLALAFQREIGAIAAGDSGNDTAWLKILGSPPTRQVVEQAFNLPRAFGALDLDRQVDTLRQKAAAEFGDSDVAQFADPGKVTRLIQKFLVNAQISALPGGLSGASAALTLLQGGAGANPGSRTIEALFSALY
jgi:uncharacterized protein DUF1217